MGGSSDISLSAQRSAQSSISTLKQSLPNPYLPAPAAQSTSTFHSLEPTSKSVAKNKSKGKTAARKVTKQVSCANVNKSISAESATLTPHGLPPTTAPIQTKFVYLFFRFCAERHRMYERRQEGVPRDQLSEDETFRKTFVGNIYRELDGGSFRVKDLVVETGEQTVEEVLFRILLFCAFYSEQTYRHLTTALGHPPRYSTFTTDLPLYESTLRTQSKTNQPLYYSGFQIVPPTVHFGRPHYAASLRFVLATMYTELPRRMVECRFASDASALLQAIPTIGGFNAQNLTTFFNNSSLFKLQYRNHSSCGPGSRAYLKRIFGRVICNPTMEEAGLRWMYDNQWKYWARLGEDIPHAWSLGLRPGIRVLDIENSMCWCHRYINDYTLKEYANLGQKTDPEWDEDVVNGVGAPAWCEEEKWVGSNSKVVWEGDWEELQLRKESEVNGGEEVWEVEKVVARGKLGGAQGKKMFRVRWSGFMPEEDTWEPEHELKKSASEALGEWVEWEKTIVESFERVKKDFPLEDQVIRAKDKKPKKGKKRTVVDAKAEDVAATSTTRSKKRRRTMRKATLEEAEEVEDDELEDEELMTPSSASRRLAQGPEHEVKVEEDQLNYEVKLEQEALDEEF